MKKLLLLLLLVPMVSFGQNRSGLELCIFLQQATPQFTSTGIANNALDKILEVNNLRGEFVLVPCDQISNVVAMTYNGTRYVLYDKEFMASLDDDSNITNLSILAHEIGHHVNGHVKDIIAVMNGKSSPMSLVERRQQELEADEFAGFTLSKLGVSIKQVNKVFKSISDDDTDTYSTHPSLSKRLAAVKRGYDNNNKAFNNRVESQGQELIKSPTLYYLKISDLYRQEKYDKAQELAYEAIEKYPYNTDLYYWRAKSIYSLLPELIDKDFALKLIIELYDKAIGIDPDYFAFYYWRGSAKVWLGDQSGAIEDLNKSILLKSYYKGETDLFSKEEENIYVIKGLSHYKLANYSKAIMNLNKGFDLGFKSLEHPARASFTSVGDPSGTDGYYTKEKIYVRQLLSLSYMKQKDYVNALKNIDKDIVRNPENYESYRIKAVITGYIEGYEEFDKSYQIYLQKLKLENTVKFKWEELDYLSFLLNLSFYSFIDSDDLYNIQQKLSKTTYPKDFKEKKLNQVEEILNEIRDTPYNIEIIDNLESTSNGGSVGSSYRRLYEVYSKLYNISLYKKYDNNVLLEIAEKKLLLAGEAEKFYTDSPEAYGYNKDDVASLQLTFTNEKIKGHLLVSGIKINSKKFKEAIFNYNELVKLLKEKNSSDLKLDYVFNQLAVCKRESGDPNGAIQEYNNALKVNPNYTSSIGGRGTAKQYLNNLFGACDDWTRAVELGGESYQSKIDEFCNLNSSINAGKSLKEKATEELKKLKELFDLGLLTQEEFDKKAAELKKVILGN